MDHPLRIIASVPVATAAALVLATGCAEPRVVDTFYDEVDASAVTVLEAEIEDGDLQVLGDDAVTTVEARVDLRTTRTGEDKDEDAFDAVHIEMRDDGNGAAILRVWMDPAVQRYTTDVTVTMPTALAVIATTEEGEVLISDTAGVDLDSRGDNVVIGNQIGDVSVVDGRGELSVSHVTGDVVIDDGAGDSSVADIDGDVTIDDGNGDIVVDHVTGTVTISDGAGDIEVTDAGGFALESDSSGSLVIN